MFKNFPGYKVLEKIQKNKSHKRERKLPLNAIKLLFITVISLAVALIPTLLLFTSVSSHCLSLLLLCGSLRQCLRG